MGFDIVQRKHFLLYVWLLLLLLSKATHFILFYMYFEVGLPFRIFPFHSTISPSSKPLPLPSPSLYLYIWSVSSFVCAEKYLREAADVGLGIKRASREFSSFYASIAADAVVLRIIIIKRYTSYTHIQINTQTHTKKREASMAVASLCCLIEKNEVAVFL